jgi:hypothetical protein
MIRFELKVQLMQTQRNGTEWLSGSHLFILLLSVHFGYRRLAVHLHMSVGRVVFSPRRIGWVPSQLVINWALIHTEPSIKIIKVYGNIVF